MSHALLGEDGSKLSSSSAWCDLLDPGIVGWDSEVPENCPFKLEHLVSFDAVSDLAEEAIAIKENK
jgi:hypothetical protein